ncbi:MAG: DMT family transporter [Actinobacteria bacterium]|nr:DMT family transporter [Actinomycetota bacterium]
MPFGVASAIVYGSSIVVQHRTASQHASEDGQASAANLLKLLRSPVWLLAIGGDFIGFLLQLVALSTGPVVVIQPLVVLMLPVALFVSSLVGWHRPGRGDYLCVVGILGGLALFLTLVGEPSPGRIPRVRYLGLTIIVVLIAGILVCLAVGKFNRVIRGAVYGGVAGAFFGTLAVMVDAASDQLSRRGIHGLLTNPRGLVPIAGMILVGVAGIILTQLSFQIGALGATLPTNLACDPLMAVALGVGLLRERVPTNWASLVAYAFCLAAVIAGAIRLADPRSGPIEPD